MSQVLERIEKTIHERGLAGPDSAVLLMVSGGSDSTGLAYVATELYQKGLLAALGVVHVNHNLRGEDAKEDQAFVEQLATTLDLPIFTYDLDICAQANESGENIEALGRSERYLAAQDALEHLCFNEGLPLANARIWTAHTQDDRVENFYMRSIVGTGPGGFRAMNYVNGPVARPCLDVSRIELRDLITERAQAALPVARDKQGALWREDATNAHTDRFRAFVRHEIIPRAKSRNADLLNTLCRSMNLIAEEDDMLREQTQRHFKDYVDWEGLQDGVRSTFGVQEEKHEPVNSAVSSEVLLENEPLACVISPKVAVLPVPMQRRFFVEVLRIMLGPEQRIEAHSIEALCAAFVEGLPRSGYSTNIQGNLAVSANKRGVRIEPMERYRARRGRDRRTPKTV